MLGDGVIVTVYRETPHGLYLESLTRWGGGETRDGEQGDLVFWILEVVEKYKSFVSQNMTIVSL